MDQINIVVNNQWKVVVSVTLDNDPKTIHETIRAAWRALEIWLIRDGR